MKKATPTNVEQFTTITNKMVALYEKKNADYGDSYSKAIDEDGLIVAKIRLNDKINRFNQLIKKSPEYTNESIQDTLIDLACYAVMTLMKL